jgi:predicted nuclease of predicted toxin-antitoxin system
MTALWNFPSAMKLLLDQGLPRSAAVLLREAGIDTVHVGEIGYSNAEDLSILEKGREDGRVVVTLDADFHAILALSGATSPSVIRIRMEGLRGEKAARLIQLLITHCGEDLKRGAVATVQVGRIRIRELPLLV